MNTRLKQAFQRAFVRTEAAQWQYGTVGRLLDGVPVFAVTGRPDYVFVTIRQASGAQTSPPARNDAGVPHSLGLPVRMRLEGTTYVIDRIARRSDLAYTDPPPPSGIAPHLHDDRYFTESEVTGAADLGAPADTDKISAVRAGGLGSILWSAVKTALNAIYGRLAVANTWTQNQTIASTQTTGNALNVTRDLAAASTDAPVASIVQDNTGDDQAALRVQQDGTGAIAELYDGASKVVVVRDGGKVSLIDNGLAHGITSFAETDVYGQFEPITPGNGGFRLFGFSNLASLTPLRMIGVHGVTDPDDTVAAFWMLAGKKSGASITALGADELVLAISNNAADKFRVMGDGDIAFGAFPPQAKLDVLQTTLGLPVLRLASPATNDDPTQDFHQNRVATTNATVTTLFTMAIPASHACMLEAYVVARRTGGVAGTAEDCAAYLIRGLFNQVAGAAAIVAQQQTIIGESVAAYDCVFDVTGTDARIRVTGVASTNITWHCHLFHRFLSI